MTHHFLNELERLERDVLLLGGMVEEALTRALHAFSEGDSGEADAVIDGDARVDELELRIEEECLKLLALYAPTAKDLRFVIGILKITNDLERIGDLAVNLAERAKSGGPSRNAQGAADVEEMAEKVRRMLRRCLDAFVSQDPAAAGEVLAMDDNVDEHLRRLFDRQEQLVNEGKTDFHSALRVLSCAKYLERIADHTTNVAEDVIYMTEARMVRHGG